MFHQSPKHEQSTPTLSKVTESYVIEKDLKPTLLKSMDPQQYGFLPRSCTTFALLSTVHHWLKSIDRTGSKVRVSLPDYRKAFDLVDHNLLTAQLFSLGVKPSVVNWIIDFLRERFRRVKISSENYSNFKLVPAGIPQGKKIDLTTNYVCVEICRWHHNICSHPQGRSEYVTGNGNAFQLNAVKCKELIINFTKQPDAEKTNQPKQPQAKILGVTITKDLRWNFHIGISSKKASKRIYLLKQLKKLTWNLVHLLNSTLLVSGQFWNTLVKFSIKACPSIYQTSWNVSRRER